MRRLAHATALSVPRMTRRKHLSLLSTASKCKIMEEIGKKEILQSFYLFRDLEAGIRRAEAITCTSYTSLWLSYFCNLTFPSFILSLLYLWFLLLTGVSTETAALSAPEQQWDYILVYSLQYKTAVLGEGLWTAGNFTGIPFEHFKYTSMRNMRLCICFL